MKSSHSRCKKVYKTLLHNKKLRKVPQQKLEICTFCSRDGERSLTLQKSAENFIAQHKVKKSLFCGKNWGNVPSAVETENKLILQCLPLDFKLNVCAQTGSGRMVPQSPFCGASSPTSFLEKIQTKRCLITSRYVSKVQDV